VTGSTFAQPGPPGFMPPHDSRVPFFAQSQDLMSFVRGLHLTDAQDDQIFKILHDSAPALRERMKILRPAREELDRLIRADAFDAERAREIANTQAQAIAEVARLRAETMHRIRAILSPEQRAMLDRRREERHQRRLR
ncbi:MAG TPA: Spy/CpxP family protein refolding chaperone, partial [Burkholderiales bacterium]|nr:Spy/CpxP family protein refolding chaperone [Burkholderiales bacterium]